MRLWISEVAMMSKDSDEFRFTFKDLFKGIGGFIDLLTEMVDEEKDEYVRNVRVGDEKGLRGQYNLSVKLGALDKNIDFLKPAGKVSKIGLPQPSNRISIAESLCNIFDEGDYYTVVAELDDVTPAELSVTVDRETELTIRATANKKTVKTVPLPGKVEPGSLQWSYNNGILEVRLWKI